MQIRLRLNEQVSATVRQQAGQRRVHVHDYVRHLVERGLLVDLMTLSRLAQDKSMVMSQHMNEAILETRNLLRALVAVRDQQTVGRAQQEAKREAEQYGNKGGNHASPAA